MSASRLRKVRLVEERAGEGFSTGILRIRSSWGAAVGSLGAVASGEGADIVGEDIAGDGTSKPEGKVGNRGGEIGAGGTKGIGK